MQLILPVLLSEVLDFRVTSWFNLVEENIYKHNNHEIMQSSLDQ